MTEQEKLLAEERKRLEQEALAATENFEATNEKKWGAEEVSAAERIKQLEQQLKAAKAEAKEKKKAVGTTTDIYQYKGKNTFGIFGVNAAGEKTSNYPIISFQARKAQVILDNIDEIKAFVEMESK